MEYFHTWSPLIHGVLSYTESSIHGVLELRKSVLTIFLVKGSKVTGFWIIWRLVRDHWNKPLWRPWIPRMQYTAYSILHMLLFRLWYTASSINTVFDKYIFSQFIWSYSFGLNHLVLLLSSLHCVHFVVNNINGCKD